MRRLWYAGLSQSCANTPFGNVPYPLDVRFGDAVPKQPKSDWIVKSETNIGIIFYDSRNFNEERKITVNKRFEDFLVDNQFFSLNAKLAMRSIVFTVAM